MHDGGNGDTLLTLISHSTNVSSPDGGADWSAPLALAGLAVDVRRSLEEHEVAVGEVTRLEAEAVGHLDQAAAFDAE